MFLFISLFPYVPDIFHLRRKTLVPVGWNIVVPSMTFRIMLLPHMQNLAQNVWCSARKLNPYLMVGYEFR
jgi:hypothetical protein